LKRYWRN